MPTISMFFGIIIRMYNTGEHNPPHFHASYQGYNAVFNMDDETDIAPEYLYESSYTAE